MKMKCKPSPIFTWSPGKGPLMRLPASACPPAPNSNLTLYAGDLSEDTLDSLTIWESCSLGLCRTENSPISVHAMDLEWMSMSSGPLGRLGMRGQGPVPPYTLPTLESSTACPHFLMFSNKKGAQLPWVFPSDWDFSEMQIFQAHDGYCSIFAEHIKVNSV